MSVPVGAAPLSADGLSAMAHLQPTAFLPKMTGLVSPPHAAHQLHPHTIDAKLPGVMSSARGVGAVLPPGSVIVDSETLLQVQRFHQQHQQLQQQVAQQQQTILHYQQQQQQQQQMFVAMQQQQQQQQQQQHQMTIYHHHQQQQHQPMFPLSQPPQILYSTPQPTYSTAPFPSGFNPGMGAPQPPAMTATMIPPMHFTNGGGYTAVMTGTGGIANMGGMTHMQATNVGGGIATFGLGNGMTMVTSQPVGPPQHLMPTPQLQSTTPNQNGAFHAAAPTTTFGTINMMGTVAATESNAPKPLLSVVAATTQPQVQSQPHQAQAQAQTLTATQPSQAPTQIQALPPESVQPPAPVVHSTPSHSAPSPSSPPRQPPPSLSSSRHPLLLTAANPSFRLAHSIQRQQEEDEQRFGHHTWISSLFHDREGKPLLQPSPLLPPPLCMPGQSHTAPAPAPAAPAPAPAVANTSHTANAPASTSGVSISSPVVTSTAAPSALLALTILAGSASEASPSFASPSVSSKRKRADSDDGHATRDDAAMLSSLAASADDANATREARRQKKKSPSETDTPSPPPPPSQDKMKPFSFSKANLTLHAQTITQNSEPFLQYHPNSHHVANKKHKKSATGKPVSSPAVDDDDGEDGEEASSSSRSRYCLPCPLILHLPKVPLQTLYLQVQKQYTMSKKEMESRHLSAAAREELVSVPVRIMGSPSDLSQLYFVAKDVCLLIFIRKGNVAKCIGQFATHEKARLPVLCPRSNGTSSTHVLTALSMDGLKRLLGASKSPLAAHVLTFLLDHVKGLEDTHGAGSERKNTAGGKPTLSDTMTATIHGNEHEPQSDDDAEEETEEIVETSQVKTEDSDAGAHVKREKSSDSAPLRTTTAATVSTIAPAPPQPSAGESNSCSENDDTDVDLSPLHPSKVAPSSHPAMPSLPPTVIARAPMPQPKISATITPRALTIAPTSPSDQPTKIVIP